MSPLVSVVMAAYNAETYIAESIQSVLGQTHKNIQLIIVNDGSTDRTEEIVHSISDPRIDYFSLPENRHIAYATNYGFEKVRGDYVAIMDSDDIWVENKLEKQLQYLGAHPEHSGCFTWVDLIGEHGESINNRLSWMKEMFQAHTDTKEDWLRYFFFTGNRLNNPSSLFDAKVLSVIGPHNLFYIQATDMEWWVRFTVHYSFGIVEEPLIKYRRILSSDQNISSLSEEHNTRFYNEHAYIRYHFFDEMDDELFCRTFRQYFRYPEARTPLELECEKAFLICHPSSVSSDSSYSPLGLLKLEQLLSDPQTAELLKNRYHFSTKECGQHSGSHLYNDPELQKQMQELRSVNQKNAEEIIVLQSHVDASENHIQYLNGQIQILHSQIGETLSYQNNLLQLLMSESSAHSQSIAELQQRLSEIPDLVAQRSILRRILNKLRGR